MQRHRSRGKALIFMLLLASNPREIRKVEKFLQEAGKRLSLDDGTLYRLLVAATEAVNNAILHGNGSDPDKQVHVRLRSSTRQIVLRVEDEGRGFDATSLPNPLEEKNLMKDHGRGVFLIRSVMDEVKFLRLKRGAAAIMKVKIRRI